MGINQRQERLAYDSDRIRVYERDQKLYDGTIKVFVRAERASIATILPIKNGKILLSIQEQPHRSTPYLSHIGGVIERGEDPGEAAKRELLEETGYISDHFEEYRFGSLGTQMNQKRYLYFATGLEKVAEMSLDAGEKIEFKRISIDEYIDLLVHKKCGGSGWREEIMMKIIDGSLDEFKKYLLSISGK